LFEKQKNLITKKREKMHSKNLDYIKRKTKPERLKGVKI
jgi:hypothetical protein